MPRLFCFADVNRHFILHPGVLIILLGKFILEDFEENKIRNIIKIILFLS